MLNSGDNLVLLSPKVTTTTDFTHIFITSITSEKKSASHDRATQMFPLWNITPPSVLLKQPEQKKPNISTSFLEWMQSTLNPGTNSVSPAVGSYCIYALLHSPEYRLRYGHALLDDYPHIPMTSNRELLVSLCSLGEELSGFHLMNCIGSNVAYWAVGGSDRVDAAPRYEEGGRVYVNKAQYFAPVPPEVWAFQVGGYQVCHKWLKDRKGRTLTEEDITHYGNIVAALGETIRLMAEIDAVIEEHGGWPLR